MRLNHTWILLSAFLAAVGLTPSLTLPLVAQSYSSFADQSACMQDAATRKWNGFIDAYRTFNAAITTALLARRDAETAAWTLADRWQTQQALQRAAFAFNAAYKYATDTLSRLKQHARAQVDDQSRACLSQGA